MVDACQLDFLEKEELSANTPHFRFARNPVCLIYCAKPYASDIDLEGKDQVLIIMAYVFPLEPIPFLIGLTIQRRLWFDIYAG